jgi:hypothetical protein
MLTGLNSGVRSILAAELAYSAGLDYPTSDAELQTATGLAQSAAGLWLFAKQAGTESDLIAANDLTISTFTRYVWDSDLGARTIQCVDGADASALAGDVINSDASTSLVVGQICTITGLPSVTRYIASENTTSAPRWEVRMNTTGTIQPVCVNAGGAPAVGSTSPVIETGVPLGWAMKIDRTADTVQVFTTQGNGSAGDISGVGTMANAAVFAAVGGRSQMPGAKVAMAFAYSGAAAEAFISTHLNNLFAAIGLS